MDNKLLNTIMNRSISKIVRKAIKLSLKKPSNLMFLVKAMIWQRKASLKRIESEKKGLHIPPFIIASITHICNLKCKGCYAMVNADEKENELDFSRYRRIINESNIIGTSIALIAGGEPLTKKKEIFEIAQENKNMIFPVFTNGLLIDHEFINLIKKHKNIIPIISIEGEKIDTDERRGNGVYNKIEKVMLELKKNSIFFGVSITVTGQNLNSTTSNEFVNRLILKGVNIFFYIEYVPIDNKSQNLELTKEQQKILLKKVNEFKIIFDELFISFPGDEEELGGCLAAGRGFIHINPSGNLEPCPFAPFSDTNLKDLSFKEALTSDFLKYIRENHHMLDDHSGGCALYKNRDKLEEYFYN